MTPANPSPVPVRPRLPRALVRLALVVNAVACASGYVVGDLRLGEFYIVFLMWVVIGLPWFAYAAVARRSPRFRATILTGLAMTALYAFTYVRVFFFPQSSTDAVAVAILPVAQFAILAGGEGAGWLAHHLMRVMRSRHSGG